MPEAAIRKRGPSPRKLPDRLRREILSVRVLPSTRDYLDNLGYANIGRALDCLVERLRNDAELTPAQRKAPRLPVMRV